MSQQTKAPVFNPKQYEFDTVMHDQLETKAPLKPNHESNYYPFDFDTYRKSASDSGNGGKGGDCLYEFNKPTYYITQEGYKKKVQESTEPLKYKFDFKPTGPCMVRTQQFQGLSFGNKRPPPSLVDVEDYLKKASLIVENNKAVAFDINKKAPTMPDILNNMLTIPDCEKDNSFETTKTQKHEFPQYTAPMYPKGHYQTDPMRSGRDTRQEVKDNYKKPENKYNIPLPKTRMPSLPSLPAIESAKELGKVPYYREKFPCKGTYKYKHCNDIACPPNPNAGFGNNKPETYSEYPVYSGPYPCKK